MKKLLIVLLSAGLAACGGGAQMTPSGEAPVIRSGESMIVFMRASALGGIVAASVFDVTGPEAKFVGILNYGTKYAHPVAPGEYTFMVIGESADFMKATIEAGRTYYVLVTPRVGVWKARFSFRPLRLHELDGAEFAGWSAATQYVANSPESLSWGAQNRADVTSKRSEYWPDWNNKPEHQRASQTLNAADGKLSSSQHAAAPAAAPAAAVAAPVAAAAVAPAAQVSPGASSSRLPREGDSWTYRLTDKRSNATREYVAKVAGATNASVTELFALAGATGTWTHTGERQVVALGKSLFAPYLTAFSEPSTLGHRARVNVIACDQAYVCEASASVAGKESLRTPAGTFDTDKIVVVESWRPRALSGQFGAQLYGSRQLTVWYSAAAKRAVKFSSRPGKGVPSSDDIDFDLELTSYQLR